MNSFFLKSLLFFSPLVIMAVLTITTLVSMGELVSEKKVVELHENQVPYLFGKNYYPSQIDFKSLILKEMQPDIVSMGNSRSLQVRQPFFKSDYSFLNYSHVGGIKDLTDFLFFAGQNLSQTPQLMVVILDQRLLLDQDQYEPALVNDGQGEVLWLQLLTDLTKDIVTGKVPILLATSNNSQSDITLIGARAVVKHAGFRNDGSYNYGDVVTGYEDHRHEDYNFSYSLRMIKRGLANWKHAQEPLPFTLEEYERFLKQAERQNVHVVTIFPPYAPTNYRAMDFEKDYSYIPIAAEELAMINKNFSHTFQDFTNPGVLDLQDSDFFDGIHWSETANAIALLKAAESDQVLRKYLDGDKLTEILSSMGKTRSRFMFGD